MTKIDGYESLEMLFKQGYIGLGDLQRCLCDYGMAYGYSPNDIVKSVRLQIKTLQKNVGDYPPHSRKGQLIKEEL